MKHAVSRFSLTALGAVLLYNTPAVAKEPARTQATQVSGGELVGDRLDSPIEGRIYAQPVLITYGNGVTANLGIGTRYYVTTNPFWELGILSWYLDHMVGLDVTPLTTAGAGTA